MKIGNFGDQYKGLRCQNVKGNGAKQLICSIDKKPCPYQHFCTKKRIFENVNTYVSCVKRTQK